MKLGMITKEIGQMSTHILTNTNSYNKHTHIHVHMHTHIPAHSHIILYAHTHIHAHTHTCTHAHTHSTSKNTPLEVGFKWVAPLVLPLVTTGVSTLLFFKTDSESENIRKTSAKLTWYVWQGTYIQLCTCFASCVASLRRVSL